MTDDVVRYGATPKGPRLDDLIQHQAHEIRRLRRRVEETTDPAQIAILLSRLVKTRALLSRLCDEQSAVS